MSVWAGIITNQAKRTLHRSGRQLLGENEKRLPYTQIAWTISTTDPFGKVFLVHISAKAPISAKLRPD